MIDTKRNLVYTTSSRDSEFRGLIQSGEEYEVHVLYNENVEYSELLAQEKEIQESFDVVADPSYFNKSIAMQNNYSDPNYATYRHTQTGKIARLPRNHPDVLSGVWCGVTKGWKTGGNKQNYKGDKNPFYGKSHSDKTKSIIGKHTQSRWEMDDGIWKERIRTAVIKAVRGVPKTEEHRKKLSEATKGYRSIKSLKTGQCIRVKNWQDYDQSEWVNPVRWKSIKAKENQ